MRELAMKYVRFVGVIGDAETIAVGFIYLTP
jgi:hypothetical protein